MTFLSTVVKLLSSCWVWKMTMDKGLISPKESGRKRHKLSEVKSKVCRTAVEEIDAKINIPEVF